MDLSMEKEGCQRSAAMRSAECRDTFSLVTKGSIITPLEYLSGYQSPAIFKPAG